MLSRNDRIDYDLLGAAARLVVNRAEDQEAKGVVEKGVGGAVLIFCPGVGEIRYVQSTDALITCQCTPC